MLFCNSCGQCIHISDDHFVYFAEVSGTETRYLNPVTGDVEDYGDNNTETTGEGEGECPYCSSASIDYDSGASVEYAFELRAEFENRRKERREFLIKEEAKARVGISDWDLTAN